MESAKMNLELVRDVDALKIKCINEYKEVIRQMQKGYKPNYNLLLDSISFIELVNNSQLNNISLILQYLLNK